MITVDQRAPEWVHLMVRQINQELKNLYPSQVVNGDTVLMRTSTALTDGAAAAAGTLTNAPSAGDPTKWIPIVDNGTTRYIPAW